MGCGGATWWGQVEGSRGGVTWWGHALHKKRQRYERVPRMSNMEDWNEIVEIRLGNRNAYDYTYTHTNAYTDRHKIMFT